MSDVYQKLNRNYNLELLKKEIKIIVENYGWGAASQISLQSPDDSFHSKNCVGTMDNYPGRTINDFKPINSFIGNDWEISKFINENEIYRTRIMKLGPKQCYSMHTDGSQRIHLAIFTDPKCFFVINNSVFHIPADSYAYKINTTLMHTAINSTTKLERIHLVGCLKP